MNLRAEQKELTRRKVLTAVLELVAEGSLDDLSVPAVARRSGVSVATIYRYFPTRDDLLAAAADEPSRVALDMHPLDPAEPDPLAAFQRSMWHSFATNMALLRHQISSESGREMRDARLDRSRRRLADHVRERGVDPDSAAGRRLVSLLLLTSGSLALVELHDRQGLAVDDAIEASRWAADVLIEASRSEIGSAHDREDREARP
ncbi:MAG: TetR/AcrR family transcriptional regulator [Acidimicrobiales bacterium]